MSLRVWLPLNGDLRNLGCSDISPQMMGNEITFAPGKIGQAAIFPNDCSSCIHFPGLRLQTGSWTAWIKVNGEGAAARQCAISEGRDLSKEGVEFFLTQEGTILSFKAHENIIATAIELNKWYHIAGTFGNGEVKLYLDGVLKGTQTYSSDMIYQYASDLTLGKMSYNYTITSHYFPFNGQLNDVRIYDHCLSAAEVKEIARGLVLHYKLNQNFGLTDIIQNQDTYRVYNNFSGSGTTGTLTNLNETYQGHVVRRETMTPNDTSVANFKTSLSSHGVFGHSQTFLANTKYVFWIYFRPISHMDMRVGGTASNIGGWTEIPPKEMGNGWYRVGQYRNGTVTSDKYDNIFTSFRTPTAESGVPITIDWAAPHLLAGTTEIPDSDWFGDTEVIDSSGYGHNGTIIGDLIINKETKRYSASTKWNCSSPTDNSETGICYIQTPFTLTTPLQLTVAWWAKPENGYGGNTYNAAFCTSNSASRPTDYNTTALHHRDSGFDICPSDGSGVKRLSFTYIQNEWHHYAITYDGTTAKVYRDGKFQATVTVGTNKTLASFSQLFIGYSQAGGVKRKILGSYSDFRIYCTPLLDTDIKSLYNMSMKIDNLSTLHTYELEETNTDKLIKTGVLKSQSFYENGYANILHYDKNIYIEPDGSTWVHICHHNNPANGVFSSNGSWATGYYIDADRWYDVEQILSNLIEYEFMVKQKTTSSAAETKYRWIQSINPMNATWTDVKPGTITFITTGYSTSSYGGLYYRNSNNQRMCIANSSNGNWYGGIGVWAAYQGGIPGYPNTTVTSGYVDLYVRVYVPTKLIKDKGFSSIQFIEA